MKLSPRWKAAALSLALATLFGSSAGQDGVRGKRAEKLEARRGVVRSVTIPVTVRLPEHERASEELRPLGLTVTEDGERQEILATRSAADRSPLYLAVLIQDDLVTQVSNEITGLADFIRRLPADSYVMVGYLRAGSTQIRQKFTSDRERAAKALRIPVSSPTAAPYNPYSALLEALKRFQSQPFGRRAALVITDGLDVSRGFDSSTPDQSIDLQRAISDAQRRGVAVYAVYAPTYVTERNLVLVGNAQGSLQRLADETGGRAFFQGTLAPVSFDPFLRQLRERLEHQIALTYLSTHSAKGFHRIRIGAALEEAELSYPSGYTRK